MDTAVPGTLKVSNDVIADLAGYAAMMCYGVVGMAYSDGQDVITLFATNQLRKGIDVDMADGTVQVTLHVVVESNVNMRSVSQNLESSVRFMLKQVADIENVDVRVVIEGLKVC
ncbi:Asp23/Gls24 family envelope stress response protein [Olsenella sp. YH-ols2217]|uniref:Asp23/Gls24 family envelope stress response protein n=1 Tax=Kribbibacterium absianum TaxID=3044210 RepID=A0ABT6ZID9_9ACTN|nr:MULTISPECIES: Asp23/Gls24 family envelope stress response protein [unclassified Olsenella]MDJ1121333.1 Asp23/Gls24 family envelope stress response protein [Olsenella sp. YH-ols2216]MDJ1128823.1 Asp23/Gls24 family envelope stress response protein [Olsenella sp. YH-ols2217]